MIQDITIVSKGIKTNIVIDSVFSVVAKLTKRLEADIKALKFGETIKCYDNATNEQICVFQGKNEGRYQVDINPKYRE